MRSEIRKLFHSTELKGLWSEIQKALPNLHFDEDESEWREARIDCLENSIAICNSILGKNSLPLVYVKDLYPYISQESFKIFCEYSLLELDNQDIDIADSDRDIIIKEYGMTIDEFKQRCKTYDILDIAEDLLAYHLLSRQPKILLEYYEERSKEEGNNNPDWAISAFENDKKFYSKCQMSD